MRAPRFLVAAVGLSACASLPPAAAPLTGEWGGTHVGLVLTTAGGKLDYDCAEGIIAGPVVPRADGSLDALGTHTPGWGGPEIEGQVRPVHSARYSGMIRGDRMRLQADLENGVTVGPFTLRRGAEPTIFRCL